MRHTTYCQLTVLVVALAAAVGCGRAAGESGSPAPAPATTAVAAAAPSDGTVARIVFIDQEQACECTQDRIAGSWTALQAALGQGSSMSVERIHRDTQEEAAEEYRLLRPMVTVPGIYFLDEGGAIVELLQGEVTEEQVRAVLGGRS